MTQTKQKKPQLTQFCALNFHIRLVGCFYIPHVFLKIHMGVNWSGNNRAATKKVLIISYIGAFFYENFFSMILNNTK